MAACELNWNEKEILKDFKSPSAVTHLSDVFLLGSDPEVIDSLFAVPTGRIVEKAHSASLH